MQNLSYSLDEFADLRIKSLLGFIFRFLTIFFFIYLKFNLIELEWYTEPIGEMVNIILVITILFLIFNLLFYIIELLGIINFYNLNKFPSSTNEFPIEPLKSKDFQFVSDTIIITKSENKLEVKQNKLHSYFSILQGLTIVIWIFVISAIFFYIGLFIGSFKVDVFFGIDFLIVVEIIWLFSEFIYSGNSLLVPLISGIKYSMKSTKLRINLDKNDFDLSSGSILSRQSNENLNGNLSQLKGVELMQLSTKLSDIYGIFLPKTNSTKNIKNKLKNSKVNIYLISVTDKSLGNQLLTFLKNISKLT